MHRGRRVRMHRGRRVRISSDVAMATPVVLPIAEFPFTVDISTPLGSDKSRSLRERRHLPPLGNAVMPSHAGFTHRGCGPHAPREGGPPTRQMNQMNAHNSYQQNPHVDNPQVSFNVEQNVLWKQRPSSDIARS